MWFFKKNEEMERGAKLLSRFVVEFSDGVTIVFEDVISLTSHQKSLILSTARQYTKEELNNLKSGLKVTLEPEQQFHLLKVKNCIVSDKSSRELYEQNIIEFTAHSVERMLKRLHGNNEVQIFFTVIDSIKNANVVSNHAEWKGFKSLSYTFIDSSNQMTRKIVAIFVNIGNRMRIITVINDEKYDSMDFRISEDTQLFQKMLQLKQRLKNTYNKN